MMLIPIGIVAVIGLLLCLTRQEPSESGTPAQGASAGAGAVAATQRGNSLFDSFQAARPQADADLSPETMAAIHTNLQKWLAARKRGSEEEGQDLMNALQALLTDQNAAQVIRSLSAAELQSPFGIAAIRHWMHANPVAASNWIGTRPDATKDEAWAVAQGWAADTAGLEDYAGQLPESAWKENLLQEAGSRLSATDPTAAIELAQQMAPGSSQTSLLQSVAINWIASDPNAAVAWIDSVRDPALREGLIAAAAQSYALTDPAQAAAWLGASVKSDGIAKSAALNIAQTWATQDPRGAANWVSQFPDGNTKTAAVSIVSGYWQQKDPAAAAAWAQSLAGVR